MSGNASSDFNDWFDSTAERVNDAHRARIFSFGEFIRDLESDGIAQSLPRLRKRSRTYLQQAFDNGFDVEAGATATVLGVSYGGAHVVPCLLIGSHSTPADVADGSRGQPVISVLLSPKIAADYLREQGVPVGKLNQNGRAQ